MYDPKQAGLFVWAAIPGGYKDGYALSDEVLYESAVFLTPGGIFGSAGEKYVRVSLCATTEKIEEAISRIAQSMQADTEKMSSTQSRITKKH